jgi:hypothetical protein
VELRVERHFSPISLADLTALGVDPGRSVAFFGAPILPALAIPLRDASRMDELMSRTLRHGSESILESRGLTAHIVEYRNEYAVWFVADGWLIVHYGEKRHEPGGAVGFVDMWQAARAAQASFADGPELDRAWQASGPFHQVIAWLDMASFERQMDVIDRSDRETECRTKAATLTAMAPHVAAGLSLAGGKLEGTVFAELAAPARRVIGAALRPTAPASLVALREQAGLGLAWSFDLDTLGQVAERHGDPDCHGWVRLISGLHGLSAPPGLASGELLITGAHLGPGGAVLEGAAFATLSEPDRAQSLLATMLGPGTPGPVPGSMRYAIPGLGSSLEVLLSRADRTLRAAMGEGVLASLVGAPVPAPASGTIELAHAVLRPARLAELASWLHLGSDTVPFFEQFTRLELGLVLEADGVRLRGGFALAAPGSPAP